MKFYLKENMRACVHRSAHVFSANFPAELRQISLQYDSIPADIFLVSIKIMLESPHTLPMNTSS